MHGQDITTSWIDGFNNYNAWVGGVSGPVADATTPPAESQVCIEGFRQSSFAGLCKFACSYGYCPHGACICAKMGAQKTLPESPGVSGYPADGFGASYSGLCSSACNLGYCPPSVCDTVAHPLVIPTVSPFLPPSCIEGTGDGAWAGLSSFACNHGFCPIAVCSCKQTGARGVTHRLTILSPE